jgi:DNA polymerase elongation subunit (family B)
MEFKLYDFSVWNDGENDEPEDGQRTDNKEFIVQMFGMNKEGKTASIIVKGFHPFFYIKVGSNWTQRIKNGFLKEIKTELREESAKQKYKRGIEMGWIKMNKREEDFIEEEMEKYSKDPDKVSYYENSIHSCKLLKKRKLYGFDGGKEYNFVKLTFNNTNAMNKVKNLWFKGEWGKDRKLDKKKIFMGTRTELYEAKLPSLLRLFHVTDISPSGWIQLKKYKKTSQKKTSCDYNFTIYYKDIIPMNDKEDPIPLKILSFDIEASSSHGDFPLAIKRYEKLAGDILEYWDTFEDCDGDTLRDIILSAFNFLEDEDNIIHEVFPKRRVGKDNLKNKIKGLLKTKIINYLNSEEKRGEKYEKLCQHLTLHLPPLEGDKVTFIGSTFRKFGEKEPYLSHCISLDKCSCVNNVEIESYETERDVILKWVELIQREKPDIIVGYNIFGFDWKFLLERASELNCKEEFLCLSKIKNYACKHTKKTIKIASGEHNLEYPDIPGVVQIDLYNHFRREFNFSSYKLDYVSGQLIGDKVKSVELDNNRTKIISSNLMGLKVGNYICFEETGHSVDKYCKGKKMKVCEIGDKCFYVESHENPDMNKSVRWCLAKDDVTPQDIFRLSNEGPDSKAIVGKYCVMDCKLVDILLRKTDVLMGFIEIANICSIPLSFIVFRGQGIKLFSFISKKCRERGVLIPVLSRSWGNNQGYEGAICFPPKADFYIDNPVAVVDYASLYPSSMISENLSHDSKVWTKEFDLEGNPKRDRFGKIKESGEKNRDGSWRYDNLPEYKYVDVEYDLFEYKRTSAKAAAKKIKTGSKICRFAQFPNNENAIMPSILKELLAARKSTRVMGKYKTVQTETKTFIGLVSKKDDKYFIKQKGGEIVEVPITDVKSIEDTYDDFMKNVFNQRQLGFKVTANSLYGQCGAKTSDFYDKDIAASTTATGRKLLTYAKRVLEEVYKGRVCDTKYGKVTADCKVVYGDTDSCFFKFDMSDEEGNKIIGKKALEITIDLAVEAGKLATTMLKPPHDLEYEKTFWPFCLLSKKRYVGMLYEFDPNKCKRKSMGIVLKRRDNAPIVKEFYGGVIDILMKTQNVGDAVKYVQDYLHKLAAGEFPIEKLTISKSLRGFYKNPNQIAHKVLADRMAKRDPGNKPSAGTRIAYAYIVNNLAKLQGERIETPQFIKDNNLSLDYTHYITNQIMKPLLQVFALDNVMKGIPKMNRLKMNGLNRKIKRLEGTLEEEKFKKKADSMREKFVKELIFDPGLKKIKNTESMKAKKKFISSFF